MDCPSANSKYSWSFCNICVLPADEISYPMALGTTVHLATLPTKVTVGAFSGVFTPPISWSHATSDKHIAITSNKISIPFNFFIVLLPFQIENSNVLLYVFVYNAIVF